MLQAGRLLPHLTVKKLRHREVKKLVQGHTATDYKPIKFSQACDALSLKGELSTGKVSDSESVETVTGKPHARSFH